MTAIINKAEDKKKETVDGMSNQSTKRIHVPWDHEEELFVPTYEEASGASLMTALVWSVVPAMVLFALTSIILRMCLSSGKKDGGAFDLKYTV